MTIACIAVDSKLESKPMKPMSVQSLSIQMADMLGTEIV